MRMAAIAAALLSAVAGTAAGQQPAVGVVDAPCAGLEAPPSVSAYLALRAEASATHAPVPPPPAETLKLYNDWQAALKDSDFAGRCRYRAANAANAALPAATDHRVVFFGDSITELWGLSAPSLFANDVIDRGISGQTTGQMLGRFRADVIDLHPRVVHIMAGTNDIAGNTGPTTLAWIENNIRDMVDLAEAHHITVILAAVPPAARFGWRPAIDPVPTIAAYDAWLRGFATERHLAFVDYRPVLDDGKGGIRPTLSKDGVHPDDQGFALMTPLAEQAIRSALRTAR